MEYPEQRPWWMGLVLGQSKSVPNKVLQTSQIRSEDPAVPKQFILSFFADALAAQSFFAPSSDLTSSCALCCSPDKLCGFKPDPHTTAIVGGDNTHEILHETCEIEQRIGSCEFGLLRPLPYQNEKPQRHGFMGRLASTAFCSNIASLTALRYYIAYSTDTQQDPTSLLNPPIHFRRDFLVLPEFVRDHAQLPIPYPITFRPVELPGRTLRSALLVT